MAKHPRHPPHHSSWHRVRRLRKARRRPTERACAMPWVFPKPVSPPVAQTPGRRKVVSVTGMTWPESATGSVRGFWKEIGRVPSVAMRPCVLGGVWAAPWVCEQQLVRRAHLRWRHLRRRWRRARGQHVPAPPGLPQRSGSQPHRPLLPLRRSSHPFFSAPCHQDLMWRIQPVLLTTQHGYAPFSFEATVASFFSYARCGSHGLEVGDISTFAWAMRLSRCALLLAVR